MATIELNQLNAVLNEGAAVRLNGSASQTTNGETHVYFEPCEESKTIAMPDSYVEGTGRTLEVTMTLRNVCPGKRVAVGIGVSEVDNAGNEYSRGFRALTVPAHSNNACCDIEMPVTRFILPEDLRVDCGTGLCGGRRHFVIRTTNHYVDTTATC